MSTCLPNSHAHFIWLSMSVYMHVHCTVYEALIQTTAYTVCTVPSVLVSTSLSTCTVYETHIQTTEYMYCAKCTRVYLSIYLYSI